MENIKSQKQLAEDQEAREAPVNSKASSPRLNKEVVRTLSSDELLVVGWDGGVHGDYRQIAVTSDDGVGAAGKQGLAPPSRSAPGRDNARWSLAPWQSFSASIAATLNGESSRIAVAATASAASLF